jgi:hypothetical protein
MNLKISSFADAGNFSKERVILKVESDSDVGDYVLLCTALSSDRKATSGKKLAYWFPDGPVNKNDLVVLYTKKGTSSTKALESGKTVHFFYWGEDHSIWGGNGNAAVLMSADAWIMKSPSDD